MHCSINCLFFLFVELQQLAKVRAVTVVRICRILW